MKNKTEEQIAASWKNQSETPLVSVICTTYNHIRYFDKTIEGFLKQITDFPFEIIIHDDASTDGTTNLLKEYANLYPNIIVPVIQTENQYSKGHNWGHPKTINPHIRGKYVALCEGDDYWTDSGKLQKQVSYMEENPDCTMCYHAVDYEENGHIVRNDRSSNIETDYTVEDIIRGGGAFCATSSLCCRTDAYLQYPRFRTMADIGDFPQQILMGLLGRVHYFPEIMGVYRYASSGSWTERIYTPEANPEFFRFVINQINWLSELNGYTNYQYDDLIRDQIDKIAVYGIYIREQEMTKLQAVYQSASWRVGNLLIQPLHALKVGLEKIRGH